MLPLLRITFDLILYYQYDHEIEVNGNFYNVKYDEGRSIEFFTIVDAR